jgi:hypothetical protein
MRHPYPGQLAHPEGRVQQCHDHGIVPVSLSGLAINGSQQCPELVFGEGDNELTLHPGHFHLGKGVYLDKFFAIEPAPEGPDGAQVAVDAVAGETPVLGPAERVVGEAPLILQVEYEGPYLGDADVDRVDRQAMAV